MSGKVSGLSFVYPRSLPRECRAREAMTAIMPRHLTLAEVLAPIASQLHVVGEGQSIFRLPESVLEAFFRGIDAKTSLFYIYLPLDHEVRLETLGAAVFAIKQHLDKGLGYVAAVKISWSGHEDLSTFLVEFGIKEPEDVNFKVFARVAIPEFEGADVEERLVFCLP